jgi:hypothetical protein
MLDSSTIWTDIGASFISCSNCYESLEAICVCTILISELSAGLVNMRMKTTLIQICSGEKQLEMVFMTPFVEFNLFIQSVSNSHLVPNWQFLLIQ